MKLIPILPNFSTRLTGLCVLILSLTLFWTSNAHGQSSETIQTDGNTYSFGYDKDAKYRDFVIPSTYDPATQFNQITFFLRGGDGGRRRVAGICTEPGGNGAKVTASFAIGTDEGELAPGGTIRLIVGQEGEGNKGSGLAGVGGGGGTAVLYKSPAYTGGDDCLGYYEVNNEDFYKAQAGRHWDDKCWIMLAVAGGGGGAYAAGGCATSSSGKPGNAGTDGTAGKGPNGWAGGSDGGQGNSNGGGGGGGGYKRRPPNNGNGAGGGIKGGSSPSNDIFTIRGGYGFGAGGPGLRGLGLLVWGGGGGGFSGGGAGDQYQGGGGGGSFANAKAVAFKKKDGNGTDRTPNNGVITYRFELNDDLVDAAVALCKDVVISISGDEVRLVPGDVNDGSYDPNNRALSYLICAPDDFCSPAWIFDCSDIGKAYSYALKVDNGSQVTYCDFEVEIEQGSTSTFTCPSSVTVQLSDCVPILETNRNYGDVFVDFEPQNYPACNTALAYYIVQPDNTIDTDHILDLQTSGIRSDTFPVGTSQVYYTASYEDDEAVERTQNCSFSVTVQASDFSLTCPNNAEVSIPSSDYDPENPCFFTLTDNDINLPLDYKDCGDVSYQVTGPGITPNTAAGTGDLSSFDFEAGITTIKYTVVRKAGDEANCSFTIEVDPPETTSPEFTSCPSGDLVDILVFEGITDQQILDQIDFEATDECGIVGYELSELDLSCNSIGDQQRSVRITAYNGSGRSAICSFDVRTRESVAPIAVCQDLTITLNDSGSARINSNDIDNGSTDACGGIDDLALDITRFDCTAIGNNTVTLTATDESGNTHTCTATVTVVDGAAPTASCQDLSINLNASGNATITANDIDNNSSDLCGINNLSLDISSFSCDDVGDNTVTLTATDLAGNTNTCTAKVTVTDVSPPTAVCKDFTIELDDTGSATLQPEDINDGSVDACGIANLALDLASFSCTDIGAHTVTLTATDNNGNTHTCTAIATVVDALAPTALCQDKTVALDELGKVTLVLSELAPGSTDNCEIDYFGTTITQCNPLCFDVSVKDQIELGCSDLGQNNLTIKVFDTSGNSSSCTSLVTVIDPIAPTASCKDLTISLDESGSATITTEDIDDGSSDLCGIANLALDISSFACDDIGENTVTLTATDNGSNTHTCTAIVTVVDLIAPIVSCQDLTIALDESGNATITAADIDQGSSDACGIATLAIDRTDFDCTDLGNRIVILTATDNNENINTCFAAVTIVDLVAPTVLCQDLTINLDDSGNASITLDDIDAGSADACGLANLALDITRFDCSDIGDNTVTLTATDNNENTNTCTATVSIVDSTAPTASCQDLAIDLDENGLATITADDIDAASADACGIANLALDITSFDCSGIGDNTVTLTVTDNNENTNTCTATVSIVDPIAPTANCQDLTISLDESGIATISTDDIDNASADACGIANLALDRTSFACEDVGEHTITLTVTDNNENINSCAATVTVIDAVVPTAICQDLTISLNESGLATITATDIDNGSADACGIANLALDNISFGCSAIGNNTVTLTATDNNGNTNTCNATISVIDPVVPTALCQDLTIQLNDSGNASITASDVDAGSSDACGIADLAIDITDFDCSDLGANSVNLSITDNNGNGNNCTAIITVEDLVAPEVVCQDITVTFNGEEAITVLPEDLFLADASFDACGLVSFVSQSQSAISCDEVGETLAIQIVAQDPNGNTNSCTALVEVIGMPCGVTEVGIGCASGADTAYDPDQAQFTITSDGCFEYPGESIAFAGTELCGDGEVLIHLADVEGNGYAGIVMRESLAPGARMVGVASNLTRNIRSEYRAITNGNLFRSIKRRTGAEWFRIIRIGQEFKSYSSNNGISWKVIRTVNLPNMPACLQVGIQAYSINKSETFTAIIDEFIINGSGVASTYTRTAIPSSTTRVAPNIQLNPQDGGIRFQVAPNPFRDQTNIRFALSQRDEVQLQVFNLLGQQVKSWQEQTLEAGEYHFNWEATASNGQALKPGIYLVRLRVGDNWFTNKVSLVR